MSSSPSAPPKEALCYQCALRMSILFRYTPPVSLSQLLDSSEELKALTKSGVAGEPVKDDTHHARFTIVHETPESVSRYWDGAVRQRGNTTAATGMAEAGEREQGDGEDAGLGSATVTQAKGNSCIDGMFGGENAARHYVSWLCVGCLGLYQFMDLIHAPAVAADVRRSPFSDSTAISVNVNVNRSFTFAWLTTATRYFDRTGALTEQPRATAVVPEELCNFKEFYMSDLRARVLQYLLKPHADVMAAGPESRMMPGFATYVRALSGSTTATYEGDADDGEGRLAKQPRTEKTDEGAREVPAPPTSQGFTYNAESEKLVCEVYCRHHPTEQLLVRNLVPQQYCSNKAGCVLSYSVIYDYARPFLTSIGWAAPTDRDTRQEKREAATLSCGVTHANIYLMGNYRKMMRNLSQSPWFANGVRVGSFSLQEVIANPILPFFFPEGVPVRGGGVGEERGSNEDSVAGTTTAMQRRNVDPNLISSEQVFGHGCYKFHSAGREDVDVRMLGTGRPFVMEMVNPTREQFSTSDLGVLEKAINGSYNGSVEVFQMRLTDANITVRLARHSESKIKRYRCVIWSSRAITDPQHDESFLKINETKDLQIEQKTPLRVLHRRSLHARPRMIHSMTLTPLSAHWFILEVETQAGTYVKEFVHGDMGRTVPNMGLLLDARTDIIQLDVVGMEIQDLDSIRKTPAVVEPPA